MSGSLFGSGFCDSPSLPFQPSEHLFQPLHRFLQYKWALWQVDESGAAVIIAAVGEKGSTWNDFLAALPDSDCRYGGGS